MLQDAVLEVAALLKDACRDTPLGMPYTKDQRYVPHRISPDNVHAVGEHGTMRIAYIDGGNQELLRTPNMSVHLVRVHCSVFHGSRRIPVNDVFRLEFFTVARLHYDDGLYFSCLFVPARKGVEHVLPSGEHLRFTDVEAVPDVSTVGGLVRRLTEWQMVSYAVGNIDGIEAVVMDGTLQMYGEHEEYYAGNAVAAARERGAVLCALAKTTTLTTDTGLPLLAAVKRAAEKAGVEGCWYYNPVFTIDSDRHPADMSVVKLHPRSSYIFRFEVLRGQEVAREAVVHNLCRNSRDPAFPGYPYGMIDADRHARVTTEEADALRPIFMRLFQDSRNIIDGIRALDAHDRLDSL